MIVVTPKTPEQEEPLIFDNFLGGLNTSVPAEMIGQDELAECINFKFNSRGQLETRQPILKYTDAQTTAGVTSIGYAKIDGTSQTLVGDSGGNVYYIGGTSGLTPTLVDTVVGPPQFLEYNNICFVLDGSYIKYMDDLTEVKMAYDTGETLYDNYTGTSSGTQPISTAGIGCTFTTPSWDVGFTMPPTTVTIKAAETTAGTGTIECSLYDVAGSAQVAVTNYTGTALTSELDYIEINFASTDITTELGPGKEYLCLLKGENVALGYTTVSTGGAMVTSGGSYVTTQNPIMRINPGLPPKAAYGTISDKRPFFWGDPSKKGTAHYGKLTHLEYGSITSVDADNNSFEIGGMVDLYGDLWVYGTEDSPYMATLVGDTESAWEIKLKFQEAWTNPKTIKNVGNDIVTASRTGVGSLSGVQEYGDVRSGSESDTIKDRFDDHYVSTAFSGYYAKDGQYWLHFPGYTKTLVMHTKVQKRPWVEFLLPIVPTCFKQAGNKFLIGCADKYIYSFDETEYKDLGTTHIHPQFRTAYVTFPFADVNLNKIQLVARSRTGGYFDLNFYINGNESSPIKSFEHPLAISDSLTVDDLTMAVDDMTFSFTPSESPPRYRLNINCWSAQVQVDDMVIIGDPISINGIFLKYTRLEE